MSDHEFQLVVQRGPEPGKVYQLSSVSVTIGRDPMADITITDPEVSRQHVRLQESLSGYMIQDLGSTNGTYIDGQRLGGEPVDLKHGQIITMGAGVAIRFEASQDVPDEVMGRETILDFSPSEQSASVESEPEISPEPLEFQETSEPSEEDFAHLDDTDHGFHIDEPETSTDDFTSVELQKGFEEEERVEVYSSPEPYRFDEQPYSSKSEEEEEEEFVEPAGEAVVIPHEGQPNFEEQDSNDRRPWRMPAIIISVMLLILCCCCGFILFIYYYGGDWMLRQMGLLP